MPRQLEEIPLVSLKINFSSKVPLYKQLYNLIRKAILEGRFYKDQKLPGTRSLAQALKVSRNTVDLAFEQLMIEGYIYKKRGSGSFVSEIPDNFFYSSKTPKDLKLKSVLQKRGPGKQSLKVEIQERHVKNIKFVNSRFKNEINNNLGTLELTNRFRSADEIIPFQNGIPAFDEFPIKTWQKISNRLYFSSFKENIGYGDAAGYKPLREAIASYLKAYRAVNCNADQIIIVNGTQQGLDLIGRVLSKFLGKSPTVWIEDPGYYSARASLAFSGANIYPCRLDNEGLDIQHSEKNNPKPNLIFTTPSHQFPLGHTMSIARRLSLLQYAEKNNCWILEDDYDSEFRYYGNPLPSLQGLDQFGKVLYLGTFSKVLFPGLRIGYLVLPNADMTEFFVTAKSLMDRQNPIFEQIILSRFISEGYFSKHLRKMRLLYKNRQDFLVKEINKNFKDFMRAEPSASGMHIISWLPKNINDKKIAAEAVKGKIIVRALSEYSIKNFYSPGLLLGYSAFNEKEILAGLNKFKKILLD